MEIETRYCAGVRFGRVNKGGLDTELIVPRSDILITGNSVRKQQVVPLDVALER